MGKYGNLNIRELKKFQESLQKLQDPDAFVEACAKELAARLLAKVIKRTPVGDYSKPVQFTTKDGKDVNFQPNTGKKGGTLRRGWTGEKRADATNYANSLPVEHTGTVYKINIVNPVEYAAYVEYGHRTANHKGWVKGQFMMTISENELRSIAPKVLEQKIKKYLQEVMK